MTAAQLNDLRLTLLERHRELEKQFEREHGCPWYEWLDRELDVTMRKAGYIWDEQQEDWITL